MPSYACQVCGAVSPAKRCPAHPLPSRGSSHRRSKDRATVIARDGRLCGICGLHVAAWDIHIDHIVPRYAGGANHPSNYRVTHSSCNQRRGAS